MQNFIEITDFNLYFLLCHVIASESISFPAQCVVCVCCAQQSIDVIVGFTVDCLR